MYSQISEKLKMVSQTNLTPTITMNRFCHIPNQVAFVCKHYPCEIGGYHDHDFFEINYIQKGECVNFVEGEAIYMPEGSFILLNTATFHTLYAPKKDSIIYNILLDKEWFLKVIERYPLPDTAMGKFFSLCCGENFPIYVLSERSAESLKEILTYQCNHNNESSMLTEANILYCVNSMMNEKDSILSPTQKRFNKTMHKIQSYVNQNFNTVTLESLSAHIGYSTTHTGRLFKKYMKKSFSVFVKELKIEHAKYLLKFSQKPIAEISEVIGYENPEHFCRTFKSDMGMSPKEYRQKYTSFQSETKEVLKDEQTK